MGCAGVARRTLHRAPLGFPRDRQRRHHHQRQRQDHAQQPRHDVVRRDALGIVPAMHHHLERRRLHVAAGHRALEVMHQCVLRQRTGRRHRRARRRRIGCIRLDQQLRPFAPRHAPREIARYRHRELHLAPAQHHVQLLHRPRLAHDVEERGVLQRRQRRARKRRIVLHQHRRRQVPRLAVDRIAEQQQLHDRDHQDHRVGEPVARELHELLRQHGKDARRPGVATLALATCTRPM